jgi:F-type H+-transporting ATPase subunit alpha
MILYAAVNGHLDDIPVARVGAFEVDFYKFMDANHPEVGQWIAKTKELSTEAEEALRAAIQEFKKGFK